MKIGNEINSTGPIRGTARTTPTTSLRGLRGKTAYTASAKPAKSASADISSPAQLLARAAGEVDAERDVRDDVVEAARAHVQNWKGLSETQLDDLVSKMLTDLS